MTKQMVTTEYQINVTQERSMWSLMKDQAEVLIKSEALPPSIKNAAQAMAIIQYGREIGHTPMTSLQNIDLIKGKPTMSANLIGARLKKYGYDFFVKERTEKQCTICFTDLKDREQEFTYTMEDAEKAGLPKKVSDPNYNSWKKYPKEMLYARCLSMGGKIVAPEVLMGIYTAEELGAEVNEQGRVIEQQDIAVKDISKKETTHEKTKVKQKDKKKSQNKKSETKKVEEGEIVNDEKINKEVEEIDAGMKEMQQRKVLEKLEKAVEDEYAPDDSTIAKILAYFEGTEFEQGATKLLKMAKANKKKITSKTKGK